MAFAAPVTSFALAPSPQVLSRPDFRRPVRWRLSRPDFAALSAGVSRWRAAFPPSGRSALALPPLRVGPLPLQARVLTAPKQRRHLLTQRPFDLSFRVCLGVGAQYQVGDR